MTVPSYCWQPIEDVEPHAALGLGEPGLGALAQVWREQRERLSTQEAYRQFEERLQREWAIETGLIERLYTFDRGITQQLIEHGIQAALIPRQHGMNAEAVAAMINDHKAAVENVFDFVKDRRHLSTSYIKEMHALMTRQQKTVEGLDALGRSASIPLIRGDYKRLPNNPCRPDGTIHEYCPPHHVASEMDRLIVMHHKHQDYAPEVEAAWLHHRFTQIHPFQDGNGRIARALATLVFIKAGWFPIVIPEQERAQYISVLEDADSGDLEPLVRYFARLQRTQFLRALSITEHVRKSRRVADQIRSIRQRLKKRKDSIVAELEAAESIAASLLEQAKQRLDTVAADLSNELSDILEHVTYYADSAANDSDRSHWHCNQIVRTAEKLGYFANFRLYRAWTRLVMHNANKTQLLISVHGIGRQFQGVLACSASWFQRVEVEGSEESGSVVPATDEVFLINYKEPVEEAAARFSFWLEDAIVHSLRLWQEAEW